MMPCSLVNGSQCLKGACCNFGEFRSSIVPQKECNNPGDYTPSHPKTLQPFGGPAIISSIPLQIKFFYSRLLEVRDRYLRVFGSNPAADMKDNRSTLDFLENCHCLSVC
jgi:hypothetical protein